MTKPIGKKFPFKELVQEAKKKAKKNKETVEVITKAPDDMAGMSTSMSNENFHKALKLAKKKTVKEEVTPNVIVEAKTQNEILRDESEQFIKNLNSIVDLTEDMTEKDNLNKEIETIANNIRQLVETSNTIVKENLKDEEYISGIKDLLRISEDEELPTSTLKSIKLKIKEVIDDIKQNARETYKELLEQKENKIKQYNPKEKARYDRLTEAGVKENRKDIFIDAIGKLNLEKPNLALMENLNHQEIIDRLNEVWVNLKTLDKNTAVALSVYEPSGQGKGEVFIEYVFDDALSLGGGQSYDISAGSKNYEVKCYASETSAIRLGTEGKIAQFEAYDILLKVYTTLQNIMKLDIEHMSLLQKMVTSATPILTQYGYNVVENDKGKGLIKFLEDLNTPEAGGDETLYEKLRRGEFNSTDIHNTQIVINSLKAIADALYQNKFEYAKLMNGNEIYTVKNKTDNSGEYDITTDPQTNEVTIKCEKSAGKFVENKVVELVIKLRDAVDKAVSFAKGNSEDKEIGKQFLKALIVSLSDKITESFESHPLILINIKTTDKAKAGSQSIYCIGIYTKFIFNTISQAGASIKVVPEGQSVEGMINELISKKQKNEEIEE